ncbi:3'-phosphoadenosine 5'-phosphosulfate sulfotransferase (PAPS reductase)/FAD synthetase [Bradyrhizobium sp. USDA 4532]|nr:3'-phosphoadenosine 5'-phosphosulfate sulfotransferase (PAPS reductase)/FAD synthetase [Bradyrhizobium sp. USDA 4532]
MPSSKSRSCFTRSEKTPACCCILRFCPAKLPFPLLHVNTTWKFREIISFRDATAKRLGLDLIVHVNKEGIARGRNPIDSGSALHTQVMKTDALKQALELYRWCRVWGSPA